MSAFLIYQLHKVISNCEDVLILVATFLVFDKGELLESKDLASHLIISSLRNTYVKFLWLLKSTFIL